MTVLTAPQAEGLLIVRRARSLWVRLLPTFRIGSASVSTAFLTGLADAKQIGRYARADGPEPRAAVAQRLRHGYKVGA